MLEVAEVLNDFALAFIAQGGGLPLPGMTSEAFELLLQRILVGKPGLLPKQGQAKQD